MFFFFKKKKKGNKFIHLEYIVLYSWNRYARIVNRVLNRLGAHNTLIMETNMEKDARVKHKPISVSLCNTFVYVVEMIRLPPFLILWLVEFIEPVKILGAKLNHYGL